MKYIILFILILFITNCSKPKTVLICGDHICINKAEAKQYFEDNLTLEVKVIDNKVVLTKVSLGKRVPNKIEITQGLSLGDTVVTEGQIKLRNGAPVMILPSNTN